MGRDTGSGRGLLADVMVGPGLPGRGCSQFGVQGPQRGSMRGHGRCHHHQCPSEGSWRRGLRGAISRAVRAGHCCSRVLGALAPGPGPSMVIIVTVTLSPVTAWPALTSLLPGFPPQHGQVQDLVGAELRELGCREPRGVQGGDPGRCVSHLVLHAPPPLGAQGHVTGSTGGRRAEPWWLSQACGPEGSRPPFTSQLLANRM